MLYPAIVLFIISAISALLGFGGVSTASAGIARIFFYIFMVAFLITVFAGAIS